MSAVHRPMPSTLVSIARASRRRRPRRRHRGPVGRRARRAPARRGSATSGGSGRPRGEPSSPAATIAAGSTAPAARDSRWRAASAEASETCCSRTIRTRVSKPGSRAHSGGDAVPLGDPCQVRVDRGEFLDGGREPGLVEGPRRPVGLEPPRPRVARASRRARGRVVDDRGGSGATQRGRRRRRPRPSRRSGSSPRRRPRPCPRSNRRCTSTASGSTPISVAARSRRSGSGLACSTWLASTIVGSDVESEGRDRCRDLVLAARGRDRPGQPARLDGAHELANAGERGRGLVQPLVDLARALVDGLGAVLVERHPGERRDLASEPLAIDADERGEAFVRGREARLLERCEPGRRCASRRCRRACRQGRTGRRRESGRSARSVDMRYGTGRAPAVAAL